MIKVYEDTKVFVHCPGQVSTGGAELLHQIVDIMRNNKVDAYIVYYGDKGNTVPSDYQCYNISIANEIEDSERNIEIIYEGRYDLVRKHKKTQKFLWWLSVDHFYMCASPYLSLCDLSKWSVKMAFRAFLRRSFNLVFKAGKNSFFNTMSIKELKNMKAMHGYQSEYAQNFLQNHGFGEIVPLKDYINTDHIKEFSTEGREDIVLYNPKKGMAFTQKLIKLAPETRWVAVQNMTRTELVGLMRKSKLYIDFGYHPGKDRLPRECAMNGCCIITGKRGSARFFEDVAIGDEYKFDERKAPKQAIADQVRKTLKDYNNAIDDFQYYRAAILREKVEFEEQVINLFCKIKNKL